jgi:hypothetical protein
MKQRHLYFALLILLLFALAVPVTAWASPQESSPARELNRRLFADKIVFGGSFTLNSGDQLDGDLIVFGGNVTLKEGSQVNGDVIVMGGNLEAGGKIRGDVSCIGGNVNLLDTSVVNGDVHTAGGANLNRAEGSQVLGNVRSGSGPYDFNFTRRGRLPGLEVSISPLVDALWFLFQTFFWAGLAVLLVMFLPSHVERTANAAISQPLITGGVGLLTLIVAVFLLPILAITLILLPASLIGALLLAVAWLFGMAALGLEVGRRIERQFHQDWPPAVSAGVGTFVFVLVIFGLSKIVPCVGWAFPVLAGVVAIGAVLLTRFGMQGYPPLAVAGAPWGAPSGGASSPPPPAQDIDEADWTPVPPEE